jgi:hypothetical protein
MTSAIITASEVGVMTTLTDLARDSASRNVGADIGKLFGEAIAKKVDTDLAGLLRRLCICKRSRWYWN